MCEPQEANAIFIPRPLLESAARAELLPLSELVNCRELYAGLDVGRTTNFSLLWINEKVTPTLSVTRYIYAIQGEDFPTQDAKLSAMISVLPNLRRVCIDATGMGVGLTDYLQKKWGKSRIEGVTFTQSNKEVMGFRLKKQLEDQSFLIPADQSIYDDFQLVKQDVTASGNIRLSAGTKNDSHADYFWGAALALEASSEGAYVPPSVRCPDAKAQRSERINRMLNGFTRE